MVGWIDGCMDLMDGWFGEGMDGRMNSVMDGLMDGLMDVWMDGWIVG